MTISRIYQNQPLKTGLGLKLTDEASHHLARVLRANTGDLITVFNGEGGEYEAVITEITKKSVSIEVKQYHPREAESKLDICLAQGISRGEKMDYTIQKAVELGVKTIIPLFTERCNVKLDMERSEKRVQHWRSIIIGACEQSGRNHIPELLPPQSLITWLPTIQADFCLVLCPHADKKITKMTIAATSRIVILIGPEGGLSQKEISETQAQGFLSLNLGPRILRTETAAIAAITMIQSLYGDMTQ